MELYGETSRLSINDYDDPDFLDFLDCPNYLSKTPNYKSSEIIKVGEVHRPMQARRLFISIFVLLLQTIMANTSLTGM